MTLPAPTVLRDPDLTDPSDSWYAFLPGVISRAEPPGAPRFSFESGLLVGPVSDPGAVRGFRPNGTPVEPLWTTRQGNLAGQRRGAEVGEVTFRLPRPAHTPRTHVAHTLRAGSDQGSAEHLNAFSWYRRAGSVEAVNIKARALRPGLLEADVTLTGRGSLVALCVPRGARWEQGVTAVSGVWRVAQEREHTVRLPVPSGAWRVLVMAGNEVMADGDDSGQDPADDVYEPRRVDRVRAHAGRVRAEVTLPRPGACVAAFVPQQALSAHVHPRFGARASSPDDAYAFAAAWVGGGPSVTHDVSLNPPRGDWRLVVFGAPYVLAADADLWT